MLALNSYTAHFGQLTLTSAVDGRLLKQLDDLTVEFRAADQADFIARPLLYKFDNQGHVNFFTQMPQVDLLRQFEHQDHWFRFNLTVSGFEPLSHTISVTRALWDTVQSNIEALFLGQEVAASPLLFDAPISLTPTAVVAHVSVFRHDNEPIDAADFAVRITSPVSMTATAIGSLAVWSFNPLPVVNEVTVEVTDASGETQNSSTELIIDYSQAVNRWEIPVSVAIT